MNKDRCLLASVHNRLNEAHKFWHDMLAEYQNPENFRIDLNAAIQALRNVTFVLQNHKSRIPEFDKWYESYRDQMKKDEILNWLHQARNIIVKQKDLELHSIASARVRTWDDISLLVLEISLFLTTEQLTKDLLRLHVIKAPQSVIDHAVLTVERTWAVNDLPNYELLSVISRSYLFLENLVLEAHRQANLPLCEMRQPDHESFATPCMSITRDSRSVNVKLRDQTILPKVEFSDRTEETKTAEYQEALKRYRAIEPSLPKRIASFPKFARIINERARKTLILDKGHKSMFLLCYPNGDWNVLEMNAENQSEKFILVRSVADQVQQTKANGVIAISEAWTISEAEQESHELPAENPKRREALNVVAADKDRILSFVTFFTRDKDGNVQLGETHEAHPKSVNIMRPIIEALRSNAQIESA